MTRREAALLALWVVLGWLWRHIMLVVVAVVAVALVTLAERNGWWPFG